MNVNEPKLEDIPVVRVFPSVFLVYLLGLPPSREVEFRIDLIPRVMPVAKSPYPLAPIDMAYLDKYVIVFIDDILIYLKSKEKHEVHLELVLELHEKKKLFGKFSKCEFWLQEVCFLIHVVNIEGETKTSSTMSMTIHSSIKARILEAQSKASKGVNTLAEMLKGLDKQFERKKDGGLYLAERIWVPFYGNLRTLIMSEAHAIRYSVHRRADKMYYDLRGLYWWPRMKKNIAMYVSKCLTCSKVKVEHQKPLGLLQQSETPEWKSKNITMDFVNKLPRTQEAHIALSLSKETHKKGFEDQRSSINRACKPLKAECNLNIFPPLDNHELTIRRRSHFDPTLLNNSEMAAEGPNDLPVPDLRTMEELCQPSLNGQGGPIASISIQAMNFGLKNDMIQQSIKVNGVTDDALHFYLFPHSLTHHATALFDRLLRNSINTFEQMAKMFLEKYFPPSMVTKLRNEITNFRKRPDESLFEAWERYKLSIDRCLNHNMLPITQIDTFYNDLTLRHRDTINAAARGTFMKRRPEEYYDLIENITLTTTFRTLQPNEVNQQVKVVTLNCETCGGPHSFFDCPATVGNTQNVYAAGAYQGIKEIIILRGTTREETSSSRELTKIPQHQVVTTNEFTNFMKANDAILKNMQTNMTCLTNSNLELKNMFGQFMKMNTASSLGSGTLLGNTITNPKEDLKGIATRSGNAYPRPTIPTSSSPVVERDTEETKDTPVNSPIIEHVASPVSTPRPNQRTSIPYPSKLQDRKLFLLKKLPKKLGDPDKFMIPCDFLGMTKCLALADLDASINLMPLSVWNKLSLPDLSPMCMTLKLVDRSISRPVGVAEDVFVKVGTFHFLADFVVVDFDADPRVPLILGRSFLKTERALIDVFEGELTLHVGKEAITFNLDHNSRYSANYNDTTANRIDVIDMACKEYSDFLLEEVDAFLTLEDDPTSPEVDQSYIDTEGDILLLEDFLNDDPSHYYERFEYGGENAFITVLKSHKRAIAWKLSNIKGIDTEFCTHKILMEEDFEPAEKSHFMVKEGIVIEHKIYKEGIEVDKSKVDVIAKLSHPTTVKGIRSFLGHASFYRRFIKDFSKISRPMTHLLEKDTSFLFSKECVKAFQTLKRKLIEAPILIAPDWDMPFELMCDASNFVIGAVLGKSVVYAFENFWSYLIMNKSIMYTDHFALKYLFAKKDSKARFLRWVLLLQELTFKVIDTKGAEILAADHLSRLENPHQNMLDSKEINESFPLETLNFVSTHEDVYMAKKPLTFSRLATMDPPGDTMAQIK
nr:reverse transcriptase domain-containing protein [Tanacetum cinerariifolium]